ncbi:response regulator [Candidatus Sumerlaeota bacterium]
MADRRRIMVVDDEVDTRKTIALSLSRDYDVIEAHDGLDALDKIQDVEPDLIVMDVLMPLMDGYRAVATIRAMPQFKNVTVLFLSALSADDDIRKAYSAGANLYLTKPFDPVRLLRNISLFFDESPSAPRKKRYAYDQLEQVLARKQAEGEREDQPPPAETDPQQASAPPGSVAKPVRVMIVDDDPEIVDLTRVILEEDYEVVSAADGLEAIERIVHYEPDVILLDAMMPKLSGYQLCQSLRRNARYAAAPIIFISVKCTPKDREYARKLGANDFIGKPFEPGALTQTIRRLTAAASFRPRPKKMTVAQIEAHLAEQQPEREQPFQDDEL